jgi:hypothetical protein
MGFEPRLPWWLSVVWQPTAELEPAHAQDRSSELPVRLLA